MALLAKGRNDMSLTLIEFAENIPFAAYYMSKILPDYCLNIVTSSGERIDQKPGNVYLVPAHISAQALDTTYDLFCNHVSLGEMSRKHFDKYINSRAYTDSTYRQIVNRFSSNPNPSLHYDEKVLAWRNNMNILDYKLDNSIYFDIFPFNHFLPLHESRSSKSQLAIPLKSLRSWLPRWKRSPVTSQCFEAITRKET